MNLLARVLDRDRAGATVAPSSPMVPDSDSDEEKQAGSDQETTALVSAATDDKPAGSPSDDTE